MPPDPMTVAALIITATVALTWVAYLRAVVIADARLPTWQDRQRRHLAWLTTTAAAAAAEQAIPILEHVANTGRWEDLPDELLAESAARTGVAYTLADQYRSSLPAPAPQQQR